MSPRLKALRTTDDRPARPDDSTLRRRRLCRLTLQSVTINLGTCVDEGMEQGSVRFGLRVAWPRPCELYSVVTDPFPSSAGGNARPSGHGHCSQVLHMSDPVNSLPQHVSDNIEKIAEVRHGAAKRLGRHQRAVEAATSALGRPRTLYWAAALVAGWMASNVACQYMKWPVLDRPPFFWLQGACTLYAAFVTTMVLVSQNRQRHESERRAHLELQVNLLAEQKVTKIIALLEELRRDMPMVLDRTDAVADAMQEQVDPEAVLSELEESMRRSFVHEEP